MATYRGSVFEAGIGPTDDDIVLFAACPPPEELGFEPATGHWRKQLRIQDVQTVWESRPVGRFRGERCVVLDDLGDRLHIGYLGHDGYKAEQLGYWQVDRGVFELVARRTDVADILEERITYPRGGPGDHQSETSHPAAQLPKSAADTGFEPMPRVADTGSWLAPTALAAGSAAAPGPAYQESSDDPSGIALPMAADAPLPLEAAALRAYSAARRARQPATAPSDLTPSQATTAEPAAEPAAELAAETPAEVAATPRHRRAAHRQMATEQLFAELAGQAGIPAESYAIGGEVDGALCLVQTEQGFEVFLSADGARHELQAFASEEAAYFYLFGVLAAEAVRTGALARPAVPARPVTSPAWRADARPAALPAAKPAAITIGITQAVAGN